MFCGRQVGVVGCSQHIWRRGQLEVRQDFARGLGDLVGVDLVFREGQTGSQELRM